MVHPNDLWTHSWYLLEDGVRKSVLQIKWCAQEKFLRFCPKNGIQCLWWANNAFFLSRASVFLINYPQSEKQFYLDQAKKLKESFNSKYPDYVYRRRPNNSRKKRRADSAPYDTGLTHEYPDDYDGVPAVDPHSYRLSYGFAGNTVGAPSSTDAPYYSSSRSHHDPLSLSGPGTGGGPHGPGGASLYNPHPSYAPTDSEDQFPSLSLWPPSSSSQSHNHQQHNSYPTKVENGFHSPKDLRLEHPAHANHHPSHHAFPKLGPAFSKVDPWAGDPLRISSRRGLHPLPSLPTPISQGLGGGPNGYGQSHNTHHVRNWSDSTGSSSVSPPSSAGSGGFPPGFGSSTNGGTGVPSGSTTATSGSSYSSNSSTLNGNSSNHGFQTLTAPFYPGGSSALSGSSTSGSNNTTLDSPSISSISTTATSTAGSSASFYSNTRGESYDSHSQSASSHQRYPTLALSPVSVAQSQNGGLWSSMRTKAEWFPPCFSPLFHLFSYHLLSNQPKYPLRRSSYPLCTCNLTHPKHHILYIINSRPIGLSLFLSIMHSSLPWRVFHPCLIAHFLRSLYQVHSPIRFI